MKLGEYDGVGMLRSVSDEIYQGEFHKGKRKGLGKMRCQNGDTYCGSFFEDECFGQGTLLLVDDTFIEGYFQGRYPVGKMKVTFPNQNTYEGGSNIGMMHGLGIYTYQNGDIYRGEFVNNIFCGVGAIHFSSGDVLTAYFLNSDESLPGKLTTVSGAIKSASWNDGKIHLFEYNIEI